MKTRDAEEDEFPICPHCKIVLDEVVRKEMPQSGWEIFKKWVFFCPNCKAVLSVATSNQS
jgi:uncharacterized protein with PIN domain